MAEINQKEYLKKYLGIGKDDGKKKKKKKKAKSIIGAGLTIVDDDLGISHADTLEEAVQLLATNEDAPQVVGVIDDRPMALRIDDYRKSDKWKVIGEDNDNSQSISNQEIDSSPPRKKHDKAPIQERNNSDSDNSPPRRNMSMSPKDNRKFIQQRNNSDSDYSPPRRNRSRSPKDNRKYRGSDNSPPRRNDVHYSKKKNYRVKSGSPERERKRKSKSISPVRRNRSPQISKHDYDSDNSPPRRRNISGSPGRHRRNRQQEEHLPYIKKEPSSDNSPSRKRNVSRSPGRRRKRLDSDSSPPRKYRDSPNMKHYKSDNFPPKRRQYDSDNSPPRKSGRKSPVINKNANRYERGNYSEYSRRSPQEERSWGNKDSYKRDNRESKTNKKAHSLDNTPPRKSTNSRNSPSQNRTEEKYNKDNDSKKMTKTLDGKTAGLQNAKDLDKETALMKVREDALFNSLSADVSGANAATIIRDRKTGKIRDLKKEAEDRREKEKKEEVRKEKYTRWGKGLKQVEDREEKLAQDAYEMTKPLARYANDEDLERHLKEQEREGDPMLAYIRSKKKKQDVATGKPTKPQYDGEFMPNRYGIAPGHRWDGVDRSSGYEKRWFETINAKKAQEEDIYKWSTEDM